MFACVCVVLVDGIVMCVLAYVIVFRCVDV